jgi:general secretion pathway protein G
MTRSSRRYNRPSPRGGFTLTEVLLVLAILGVIAAMVVPNLIGQQKNAMIKAAKMSIKSLEDACTQYAIAHDGEYPPGSRDEVFALLLNPGNDANGKPISPYLKSIPLDPWNQSFHYEWPNTKAPNNPTVPALVSGGPDKKSDDGGNDDVTNWK